MFVIFERLTPTFKNYRRSPWARVLAIVVAVHALLFVLTPPFHFEPYTLAAQDTVEVVIVPRYEPPPPPDEEPTPPYEPEPYPDDKAPDHDVFVSSPEKFRKLLELPATRESSPPPFFAVDKAPVLDEFVRPRYPDLAKQAGFEGVVHVRVTIGIDGKVRDATVLWSDVTPEMDRAAVEAALACEFEPAEQQGKKVRVSVVIPFEFRLTNDR
jgi:protein TonB